MSTLFDEVTGTQVTPHIASGVYRGEFRITSDLIPDDCKISATQNEEFWDEMTKVVFFAVLSYLKYKQEAAQ